MTEEASPGGAAVAVVELAVPAAGLAAAVARLRADGHQILRVREHAVPPAATHPVPASAGRSGTGGPDGASAAGSRTRPVPRPGLRPAGPAPEGDQVIALVRLRLAGFVRTGRALAPVLAGLLVLGVLYGGGRARPAEPAGVSAVVLFPVLAWQTKILLDVEPDVQRRMARVVAGPARERAAGLIAALVAGLAVVLLALALPWPLGGVTAAVGPGSGRCSPGWPWGSGRTCSRCRLRWRSARSAAGR
ncbi:hypothetical protein V2I01_09065 [Micromonospora sp. BRA006-A]|nr:hypothetical protein [Micromonospora sp. BRA006-A]